MVGLAIAALLGACGDDNGNGTPDAAAGGADAAAGGADAAAAMTFEVTLTTDDEVPQCDDAGENAMGSATVIVAADGSSVEVMDFTHEGLSGTAMAAHIHVGDPGVAGPVVLPFTSPASPINQTFTAADYTSAPAMAPPTWDALVAEIRSGGAYLNVHTPDCTPGEIRGQIAAAP